MHPIEDNKSVFDRKEYNMKQHYVALKDINLFSLSQYDYFSIFLSLK